MSLLGSFTVGTTPSDTIIELGTFTRTNCPLSGLRAYARAIKSDLISAAGLVERFAVDCCGTQAAPIACLRLSTLAATMSAAFVDVTSGAVLGLASIACGAATFTLFEIFISLGADGSSFAVSCSGDLRVLTYNASPINNAAASGTPII